MEKIYTRKEAAELLKCSVSTIDGLCLSNELPQFTLGSTTCIRISESDIEKFIKHCHKNKKVLRRNW